MEIIVIGFWAEFRIKCFFFFLFSPVYGVLISIHTQRLIQVRSQNLFSKNFPNKNGLLKLNVKEYFI